MLESTESKTVTLTVQSVTTAPLIIDDMMIAKNAHLDANVIASLLPLQDDLDRAMASGNARGVNVLTIALAARHKGIAGCYLATYKEMAIVVGLLPRPKR